jgi:FKBP-type peptidyl-prolyl cis-trans isomerase
MKTIMAITLTIALGANLCFGAERPGLPAAQATAKTPTVLKTEKDKLSYAVGVDTARNFIWSKVQVGEQDFLLGLTDAFLDHKLLLAENELRKALNVYQSKMNNSGVKVLTGDVSYAIGVETARKLKLLGIDFNLDVLARGFRDVSSGKELLIDHNELRFLINSFQLELKQRRTQSKMRAAKDGQNKKTGGDPALHESKVKEGMIALPSGLQYKVLKEGDGRKPTEADSVVVHYRGTFTNGTEFDSSYRADKPTILKVNGVMPGLQEALQLMPVGSKWLLFIPSALAYGEKGKPPLIGPNATLVFEVELLAIK